MKKLFTKFKKTFCNKKYIIYLIRWIISGIFLILPNEFFLWIGISSAISMVLSAIVGAFCFFKIDEFILSKKESD